MKARACRQGAGRWATLTLALGLALLLPRLADAHGPTPAVESVLGATPQRLDTVQLSDAVAQRQGEVWRYVCPTMWGGPARVPVAPAGPSALMLAGARGLVRLQADGRAVALQVPDLQGTTIQQLAQDPQGPVALVGDATQGRLVRIGPPTTELWHAPGRWTALLATGQGPIVAGVVQGQLAIARPNLDAQVVVLPVDASAATVELRSSAGQLYATVSQGQQVRLGRIDVASPATGTWTPLLQDYAPLEGPVVLAGQTFVVTGGVLRRLGPAGLETVDDSRWYTCLADGAIGPHVCARTEVFRLTAAGTTGALLFSLQMLAPPLGMGLTGDDAFACQGAWENFARDGGLPLEGAPLPVVSQEPGGCTAGRTRGMVPWTLLMLLAIPWRRRA